MEDLNGFGPAEYIMGHSGATAVHPQTSWSRSSYCAGNGSCVEIASLEESSIGVRDSKAKGNPPVLVFTRMEWQAFIAGVKDGEFDRF
jgi:hypothetical protein